MENNANEVETRELVAKAKFPVRLRKTDVTQWPTGLDSATITAWEAKLRLLRQSVGKDGVTFLVIGPRGVGKSQLAVETGRHLCQAGKSVRYVRAAWLFVSIRSTYQAAAKLTEEEAIGEWLKPRLVIIDEVDKRKNSDAEDLLIENIVCQRHDDGKDTLLVSNLKKEAALEGVGASIVSRMNEGGGVVECQWGSFRQS